jgi:hypothetical protein
MDYTYLCSHGTDEEQKAETTEYYKKFAESEKGLLKLPDLFKALDASNSKFSL